MKDQEKEEPKEPRLITDRSYVGKSLDHMNKHSKRNRYLRDKSTYESFDTSRTNNDIDLEMILSPGASDENEGKLKRRFEAPSLPIVSPVGQNSMNLRRHLNAPSPLSMDMPKH